MKRQQPNLDKLELIAAAPGALREELVFVGGCAVVALPTGVRVRLISAPAFVATKFEAFWDRGHGDLLGSHDLEDIINVVDGRPNLGTELAVAAPLLRQYLATQCRTVLAMPGFMNALPGMVFPDESLAGRVKLLAQRIEQLSKLDHA